MCNNKGRWTTNNNTVPTKGKDDEPEKMRHLYRGTKCHEVPLMMDDACYLQPVLRSTWRYTDVMDVTVASEGGVVFEYRTGLKIRLTMRNKNCNRAITTMAMTFVAKRNIQRQRGMYAVSYLVLIQLDAHRKLLAPAH